MSAENMRRAIGGSCTRICLLFCWQIDAVHNDEPDVCCNAEGGMTNGRGMMRFSRGFMRFGKGLPIVPAAVRAAPVFGISTHTLTSSFAANMFWFCFAPWVDLEVTVLPPMRPQEVHTSTYCSEVSCGSSRSISE